MWQDFHFSTGNCTFCIYLKKLDQKIDWIIQSCGMNENAWLVTLAIGKCECYKIQVNFAKWISSSPRTSRILLFWMFLKCYMKASFSHDLFPARFCLYYFLVIAMLWGMILAMKWYLNLQTLYECISLFARAVALTSV